MKKSPQFSCSHCDTQYQKWSGRCLECGKWGTVQQRAGSDTQNPANLSPPGKTTTLSDVSQAAVQRTKTKISELDRVLGGGLVPGSLLLLGGAPGIGKSTIALQLASALPSVLYCCGEESAQQIGMRAQRLQAKADTISFLESTSAETICATIANQKPKLAIIDSIQTVRSTEAAGEPGNTTQMRACTAQLLAAAKSGQTAILIVGHVTKDGSVAGPRTLEHMVDTVLYLEGDRFHQYRLLRAVKNRFGSTDEVGMFSMTERGLEQVTNPSAAFIEQRGDAVPGSVLTCLMEGTRPLLVEIQALVTKTAFGYPARKASGFDNNRLQILTAILQKRSGLALENYDIHLNVAGGIRAQEPAADLGVCLAIASAYKDKTLSKELVAFGEVGLGGEVRPVSHTEKRIKECEQLGMKKIIIPTQKSTSSSSITITPVKNLQDLIAKT